MKWKDRKTKSLYSTAILLDGRTGAGLSQSPHTNNKENGTQLNSLSFGASLFIAFLKGRGFFVYEGVDGVLSGYYV